MQLELHQSGPADAEAVWQRYLRPARWAGWSPQIRQVLLDTPDGPRPALDRDHLRPGSTGTVRGLLGVSVGFEVECVDEQPDATGARYWTWRVRLGAVRLRLRHTVRPVDGGGARTELTIRGPAPVVLGYAPVAQLALVKLVRH